MGVGCAPALPLVLGPPPVAAPPPGEEEAVGREEEARSASSAAESELELESSLGSGAATVAEAGALASPGLKFAGGGAMA